MSIEPQEIINRIELAIPDINDEHGHQALRQLVNEMRNDLNAKLDSECKSVAKSMRDGILREFTGLDPLIGRLPTPEVEDGQTNSGGPEFSFDVEFRGRSFHVEIFGPPYE